MGEACWEIPPSPWIHELGRNWGSSQCNLLPLPQEQSLSKMIYLKHFLIILANGVCMCVYVTEREKSMCVLRSSSLALVLRGQWIDCGANHAFHLLLPWTDSHLFPWGLKYSKLEASQGGIKARI